MVVHPLEEKVADQARLIGNIQAKLQKPTTPPNRKPVLQAELQKQLSAWEKNLNRLLMV